MRTTRSISILIILFMAFAGCKTRNNKISDSTSTPWSVSKLEWAIVIHGGAGVITREKMTSEMDKEYRAALAEALATGKKILKDGGSALDAVEMTVRVMEDDPHFNAGKGAVFYSRWKK